MTFNLARQGHSGGRLKECCQAIAKDRGLVFLLQEAQGIRPGAVGASGEVMVLKLNKKADTAILVHKSFFEIHCHVPF